MHEEVIAFIFLASIIVVLGIVCLALTSENSKLKLEITNFKDDFTQTYQDTRNCEVRILNLTLQHQKEMFDLQMYYMQLIGD